MLLDKTVGSGDVLPLMNERWTRPNLTRGKYTARNLPSPGKQTLESDWNDSITAQSVWSIGPDCDGQTQLTPATHFTHLGIWESHAAYTRCLLGVTMGSRVHIRFKSRPAAVADMCMRTFASFCQLAPAVVVQETVL